jgi:hypothetical protein
MKNNLNSTQENVDLRIEIIKYPFKILQMNVYNLFLLKIEGKRCMIFVCFIVLLLKFQLIHGYNRFMYLTTFRGGLQNK